MSDCGIRVTDQSRFYESEPIPKSDQPWFVNAVCAVDTELSPNDLLHKLHEIESELGRERRIRWEARIIDLDILAYHDLVLPSGGGWPASNGIIIPHPRLQDRLFVLKPLMDICPDWKHPVLDKTAAEFARVLDKAPDHGIIRPLA